jgi:hypothetical protein
MVDWNVWRELRAREHLVLVWASLSPGSGRIEQLPDGRRVITLDPRLRQQARAEALGHELLHDEYDLLWPPDTPPALVEAGERFVERETVRRFLPADDLARWVDRRSADGRGTTARDVAMWFGVTEALAALALSLLTLERSSHGPRAA